MARVRTLAKAGALLLFVGWILWGQIQAGSLADFAVGLAALVWLYMAVTDGPS